MNENYVFSTGSFHAELYHLAFLGKFLAEVVKVQSLPEVAQILNKSRQAVCYMFKKDEMNLDDVVKIIEFYGYEIDFSYKTKEEVKHDTRAKVNIILDVPEKPVRRMDFVKKAIKEANLSMRKIYEVTRVANSTMNKRFEADSCPISMFYQLAEAFNWELNIKFTKKIS